MISLHGSYEAPMSSKAPGTPAATTPAPGTPRPRAAPGTPAPAPQTPAQAAEDTGEALDKDDPPYEEVSMQVAQARTIKPPYSLKRVLQKLPKAVKEDLPLARRLLLGLHEKLWHATSADCISLLQRAGMPPEVTDLAGEAVASCAVCRRYSRLPARPRSKVSLSRCSFWR